MFTLFVVPMFYTFIAPREMAPLDRPLTVQPAGH